MIRLFEEEWVEDYYTYLCHSEHKVSAQLNNHGYMYRDAID